MELELFKGSGIEIYNNEIQASRSQLQEFYGVPRKTLEDNIKSLKSDGLVNGAEIRLLAKDGKQREMEVFNFDESIALGLRLRSDKAIQLQRFAIHLIKNKLKEALNKEIELREKNFELQMINDRLWDKSDQNDLYKR
jgi:hypothetical protein